MLNTEEERKRIADVYEAHQYTCLQVARSITGNNEDAEDAVHEAFLKLIDRKEMLNLPDDDIRRLLITMTKRRAIDIVRKRERGSAESWDEMEDIPSKDEPIDIQISTVEDYDRLQECLSSLSEQYRTILQMKYYFDLSNEEICKILGKTARQTETQLRRAKLKLREAFYGREGGATDGG